MILIYLLLRNFFNEENLPHKVIIFGISFLIFLYVSMNIGMVSGLIPVVGAPLPFISHLTLSIKDNKIILGTWQGLYLFEHRLENHTRIISHHYMGN